MGLDNSFNGNGLWGWINDKLYMIQLGKWHVKCFMIKP